MATYTQADVREYAWRLLHDIGDTKARQLLTNDSIDQFRLGAEREYSTTNPLILAADVVADGTDLTATPTGWVDGFSTLRSLEYPIGEVPPTIIDARNYELYLQTDGSTKFLWYSGKPDTGQSVRFVFTALRSFGAVAADTTIEDADFPAVGTLLAAISAESIAAKMAAQTEPLLAADRSDRNITKTEEWLKVARTWRTQYSKMLGIPMDGRTWASGWANWDSRPSHRGAWLTHPKSWS